MEPRFITSAELELRLADFQLRDSDLTDLSIRWLSAGSTWPSSLDFAERTENGVNLTRLRASDSMNSDFVIQLPAKSGALLLDSDSIIFPESDPHIAGAAYWVAGVLTKSNG
jgi:hypothetical protein